MTTTKENTDNPNPPIINKPGIKDYSARRREAWELRVAGYSFDEIGDHMGISGAAAWNLVQKYHKEINKETQESARDRILAHLDTIMTTEGITSSVKLKALAMQMKIWGLEHQTVTVVNQDPNAALDEMLKSVTKPQ